MYIYLVTTTRYILCCSSDTAYASSACIVTPVALRVSILCMYCIVELFRGFAIFQNLVETFFAAAVNVTPNRLLYEHFRTLSNDF